MIVIKIKTWKDYKQEFLDWIKEPRQKVCKEYVRYAESIAQEKVEQYIREDCESMGLKLHSDSLFSIIQAAQLAIVEAGEKAEKLIDNCQPKV